MKVGAFTVRGRKTGILRRDYRIQGHELINSSAYKVLNGIRADNRPGTRPEIDGSNQSVARSPLIKGKLGLFIIH